MKPRRESIQRTGWTYFVTSQTSARQPFFRHERWAEMFIEVLHGYRSTGYLLHDFVLMPDHFHLILTPAETLERAVQLIKGGFSRRAGVELSSRLEVWQRGFSDHRIRDASDYKMYANYIFRNPVRAKLSERAADYRHGSASGRFEIDPLPQGLKPDLGTTVNGTAEAVPLQQQN